MTEPEQPTIQVGEATPPTDVLESHPPAARPRRRLMWTLGAAGTTLVLLLGVGIVYRVLSGNDRRPEEILPASVIAFAAIDLDPGLGQQVELLKLARKLPDNRDAGDLKAVIERLLADVHLTGVDVKRDITSWLGKRIGVAFWLDARQRPYALIAASSTDDAKAKEGLARIAGAADADVGFVVSDGGALIAVGEAAADQAATDAAAQAATASLARSQRFRQAQQWLGDSQIAVVWADLDALGESLDELLGGELSGLFGAGSGSQLKGMYVLGVQVRDGGINARFRTFGAGRPAAGLSDARAKLAALPGDTEVGAVLQLPDDLAQASPLTGSGLLFGGFTLPWMFGAGIDEISEPTAAEQAEIEQLMSKGLDQLTPAEQKRLTELTGMDADELRCTGRRPATPDLTSAEMAELQALMTKEPGRLTSAEQQRLTQLLGVDPDCMPGTPAPFDQTLLAGATLTVSATNVTSKVLIRAVAVLASPEAARKLAASPAFASPASASPASASEDVTLTVDGSTVTAVSQGYRPGGGTLADRPGFQPAMPDGIAATSTALYVDLTAILSEDDRKDVPFAGIGLVQGVQDGDDVGAVRLTLR
jgi:hypothetical protein